MIGLDLMVRRRNDSCESGGRSENHGNRFWRRGWKTSIRERNQRNNFLNPNESGKSSKNTTRRMESFLETNRT